MYEDGKRCWICHRTEDRLRYELPDIMWPIKGDPFRTMYFSANVIDVDKRRDTDVPAGETFYRPNLPDDVSSYYDKGKDAIVLQEGKQVTEFREGMLPWAIQRPIALVFDEYDAGRPDVMFVIQRVLEADGRFTLLDQNRVLDPHPAHRELVANGLRHHLLEWDGADIRSRAYRYRIAQLEIELRMAGFIEEGGPLVASGLSVLVPAEGSMAKRGKLGARSGPVPQRAAARSRRRPSQPHVVPSVVRA